jgi:putative transposase
VFQAACARLSIAQPMGRPGSAPDNEVIESLHSTLEFALRRAEHLATKTAARAKLAAGIEDYDINGRHTASQKIPPVACEQLLAAQEEAA